MLMSGGEIGSKDGVEDNRCYPSNRCESIWAVSWNQSQHDIITPHRVWKVCAKDGLGQLGSGRIPFPPWETCAVREGASFQKKTHIFFIETKILEHVWLVRNF